jgi:hypothetical protein
MEGTKMCIMTINCYHEAHFDPITQEADEKGILQVFSHDFSHNIFERKSNWNEHDERSFFLFLNFCRLKNCLEEGLILIHYCFHEIPRQIFFNVIDLIKFILTYSFLNKKFIIREWDELNDPVFMGALKQFILLATNITIEQIEGIKNKYEMVMMNKFGNESLDLLRQQSRLKIKWKDMDPKVKGIAITDGNFETKIDDILKPETSLDQLAGNIVDEIFRKKLITAGSNCKSKKNKHKKRKTSLSRKFKKKRRNFN